MSSYLDNFNYLEFLKRRKFIGPIYLAEQDSSQPIINALLVPVDVALSEILHWSRQETTRGEFLKYLRQNNIHVGDLEDFQSAKSRAKEQRSTMIRNTNSKLREIADVLEVSRNRINGNRLSGRAGFINEDGSISVESRSKRHLSGIGRRLGFLERTDDGFKLDHAPTKREAEVIRTVLGIKKRPSPNKPDKTGAPIENMPS